MFRVSLLLVALFALACSSAPEADAPWQTYELRGEIVDLRDGETKIAYVDHEDVPGFMGAMTMGFPVRDPEEFAKLTVGAHIEAKVMARGHGEYYLDDIKALESAGPQDER